MLNESANVQAARAFKLLHWMLAAQMPRPGGIHKYSKGNMISHLVTKVTPTGYQIIMSDGVGYSNYAMGYDDAGNKRTPRGILEAYNFTTVESCLNQVNKFIERG